MKIGKAQLAKLALAIVLGTPSFGAPKNETFIVNYDRFKDVTVVHSKEFLVNHQILTPYDVGDFVQFAYTCLGNTSKCHPEFVQFIYRINWSSPENGWIYIDVHDVMFLADGQRIAPIFGEEWSGDAHTDTEIVSANFSPKDFIKLVNSHSVEGQVGTTEFRVPEKQLPKWRVLAQEIE